MRKIFTKHLITSTLIALLVQISFGYLPYVSDHWVPNVAAASTNCSVFADSNGRLSPQPGGIALDQAATFLANMTDVTGAYYDQTQDRIVFVGKTNTTAPHFDKDDLAVAIRSVIFNHTIPTVNMTWGNNSPTSGFMDIAFTGQIENTNFGNTLYQADYRLKELSMGNTVNGQTVTSSVSSYRSAVDRIMAKNPNPTDVFTGGGIMIDPAYISLKKNDAANSFVFDQANMRVTAWGMSGNPQYYIDAYNEFAQDLTSNYDAYAQETPSWAKTKQLAKIVSVVKWLSDNGIATDFQWAKNYTPQTVTTPTTIPSWTRQMPQGGNIWSWRGGVQYYTPNTYNADDGSASSIKTSSQAANSNPEAVSWNFTQNSQQYQSVAVSADAFRRLGGFGSQAADLSTQVAGGNQLALSRAYSSMSSAQSGIGNGWELMPAKLTDTRPGFTSQCGLTSGQYQGAWPTKLSFQTQEGVFETFSYVCGGTYAPDSPAFHSSVTRDSSGYYTVKLKDQRSYKFDPNGYFIRYADKNGYSIWYGYTNLKLATITDDNNHTLSLTYNSQGLISGLSDWGGRTVSYGYDSSGNLTSVTDPRGSATHYAYDANKNLTTITDRTNSVIVNNTYNSSHKLATQAVGGGPTSTYSYDETNRIITETDNNGRVHKTYYDDKARTVEQDDPYNNKIFYTYGSEYSPLTVKDKRGNITTYAYDSSGNPTSVTLPNGKQVTTTYNSKNNVVSVSDGRYGSNPKITTFTYDSNGNMTQKNESGRITSFTYVYPGSLTSQTDPLNHATTWTRDAFAHILTQTAPDGGVSSFTYDSLGRLTQQSDASSKVTSFTYDLNNNLLTSVDAAGTTSNVYNGENALIQTTSPTNAVTQYSYNSAGSQTGTTDATSHTTGYSYDQYQNMTARQDALTRTTQYAYDQLNRETSSTTPLGKTAQWAYDANGNITARTDASNRVTHYLYDNLNRLTQTTYPDNAVVTYTYDDRGNKTAMTSSAGTSSYTYDTFDRMTGSVDPHNQSIGYQYDSANNLNQVTYPGGNIVKYAFDSNNRLRSVEDWNGQNTNYQYNKNGTVSAKALPNGIVSTYTYDNANRLVGVNNTKNQQIINQYSYARDGNGNITSASEAGPQTPSTSIIADEGLASGWGNWSWGSTLNFADTSSPYSGSSDTAWTINSPWAAMDLHTNSGVNTAAYTAVTLAIKATGTGSRVGVALHDASDARLTSVVDLAPFGGNPQQGGYKVYTVPLSILGGTNTTIYGLSLEDLSGSAQPVMYIDAAALTTAPASPYTIYDEGLAPGVLDWSWGSINNFSDQSNPYVGSRDINWTNTAGWGGLDLGFTSYLNTNGYQNFSFAMRGTSQNQVVYLQFYDQNNAALGTAKNIAAYGGNPDPSGYKVYNIPLADLSATNKQISQLTIQDQTGQSHTAYIDEMKLTPAVAPAGTAQTSTFTYDTLNRLMSASYPSGSYNYTYDAVGNRLTSNEAGVTSSYSVNNDNQVTAKGARSLSYDNQGNEITDGAKALTYDFDNRMTSFTNGAQTTSFKYDAAGNRIEKNINGVATYQYVNDLSGDLSRVLVSKNVPAGTSTYFIYGFGGLVSQGSSAANTRQYYLDDGLGNVRSVADSFGSNIQSYSYDPYGNQITGNNTTDFRYREQQHDTESGLQYLRARYYDPTLGKFTSKDSVAGVLGLPESQNGYSYAHNNPIMYSDPSGQFIQIGVAIVIAGLFWAGDSALHSYQDYQSGDCVGALINGIGAIPIIGELDGAMGVGKLIFKTVHASRHLEGTTLAIEAVEGAIRADLGGKVIAPAGQLMINRVIVNGTVVEYRAMKLADGTVSVGTYYVPK